MVGEAEVIKVIRQAGRVLAIESESCRRVFGPQPEDYLGAGWLVAVKALARRPAATPNWLWVTVRRALRRQAAVEDVTIDVTEYAVRAGRVPARVGLPKRYRLHGA